MDPCIPVMRPGAREESASHAWLATPAINALDTMKAKSRKYQGVFESKSRVKTWQGRGIWSQQLEH